MVKDGNSIKLSIDFGLIKPPNNFIYKQYGVLVPNYLVKKIGVAVRDILKQINPL